MGSQLCLSHNEEQGMGTALKILAAIIGFVLLVCLSLFMDFALILWLT